MPESEPPAALSSSRRPRWFRWMVAGVLLAVVAGGAALTRSPLFRVRSLHVAGAAHLSRDAVIRRADVSVGVNIFSLDAARAEARLEGDPWIVEATVTKDPPSTVEIRIVEQAPVATTELGGDRRLVGGDGELLDGSRMRFSQVVALPRIVSDEAPVDQEVRRSAARALVAMPSALRLEVRDVVVSAGAQLSVVLRSGLTVEYGDADRLKAKAQAVGAVLRWAVANGVRLEAVDVRVPTAPTARLAGGAVATP